MDEFDRVIFLLTQCHKLETANKEASATLNCLINYGPDIDGTMMKALEEVLEILDCNKLL